MVEETLKRYADDITLQELVRLRVENDKLKERIETLQDVVRENHDTTLEIFKERERLRERKMRRITSLISAFTAEIERLREVLKKIADATHSDWFSMKEAARAALKGDEY